jgi:carboxylesterase
VSVDAAPFDLGESRAPAAALCLHGLTGTPYEVRPLAEALARRGLRARGPALPGHNATPESLARVPHREWLAAARAELEALRGAHERVFAVGLSLGGLLCLALAAEGGVDALAITGTPLRLRHPLVRAIPLAKHFVRMLPKGEGSDIRDAAARARHPSYPVMPLSSVHELMRLQRQVRRSLGAVRAPILVAHGAHDRTAHPDDARAIVAGVGSREKELLFLERSGHVVPVDFDGPQLAEAVAGFLASRLTAASESP